MLAFFKIIAFLLISILITYVSLVLCRVCRVGRPWHLAFSCNDTVAIFHTEFTTKTTARPEQKAINK